MQSFTFLTFPVLLAFLAAFSSAQPAAQPQSVNCASFWPSLRPGESFTVDAPCYLAEGFPITIGNSKVTVAYHDAWTHGDEIIAKRDHLLSLIQKASLDTISIYSTFAEMTDVVVILGSENDKIAAADTSRPLSPEGACQVRLFWGWWGRDATDDFRLQAFAHELYHCVQETTFSNFPKFPNNWWTDGSADYFSNVVYPAIDGEWNSAVKYSPDIPLYANDAYSTNVFFQAMEQSKGVVGNHEWIRGQTPGETGGERARLSSFPGFVEDFHLFARMYSLGQIRDTNGKYVPISNHPQPDPVALTSGVPLAESTVGTVTLKGASFTIHMFALPLAAGQTVSISYTSSQSNVRISYMLPGSTVWTIMPQGSVSSAEGTIVAQCKDGEDTSVMILFTSTDDVDTASAEVTVTQASQDETCQCKEGGHSRKRGLERCKKPINTPTPSPGTDLCNAVADQPNSDPCLTSSPWKVDKDGMETLLRQNLASVPELTINRIAITGDGTMSISGTNATFTYKELTIALDVSAGGMSAPTTTVVNGVFEANLYLQASSEFCLNVYSGQGTIVGSSPLFGEILRFDLGPNGGFVEQKYRIGYQCSANRLTMQGTYNGNVAWGPYAFVR